MPILTTEYECHRCNDPIDEARYWDYEGLCELCHDEEYTVCTVCGETVFRDDCYYRDDICDRCFRRNPLDYVDYFVKEGEGYDWEGHADCAKRAENTDFGCGFDCNGKCEGMRRNTYGKRGCCAGCADNFGYLNSIPVVAVETVKAAWNEDTGFWTEKGCALPAEYRSRTCLVFQCEHAARAGGRVKPIFNF